MYLLCVAAAWISAKFLLKILLVHIRTFTTLNSLLYLSLKYYMHVIFYIVSEWNSVFSDAFLDTHDRFFNCTYNMHAASSFRIPDTCVFSFHFFYSLLHTPYRFVVKWFYSSRLIIPILNSMNAFAAAKAKWKFVKSCIKKKINEQQPTV